MITLEKFRKKHGDQEPLSEEMSDEDKKLSMLVRSGLFDVKKLTLLRRAMDKNTEKLSPTERSTLIALVHRLMDVINQNQQIYSRVRQAVRQEEINEARAKTADPPPIVLLRRKAIRVYPDGKKVALYYADKLKKYIPISYEDIYNDRDRNITTVTEEYLSEGGGGILSIIRNIVQNKQAENVTFDDGSSMKLDLLTAQSIMNIYDAVNEGNKEKLDKMINKDKNNFYKVAAFAHGAHVK